jgi:hypothetical protein
MRDPRDNPQPGDVLKHVGRKPQEATTMIVVNDRDSALVYYREVDSSEVLSMTIDSWQQKTGNWTVVEH